MTKTAAIKEENGYAIIRIPLEDAHSLKVALAPCPCKGAKSIATEGIRQRLRNALGRLGGKR